jgi:hypothetical protein
MAYYKIVSAEIIEGFDWSVSDEEILKVMTKKIRKFANDLTIEDLNIQSTEID